MNDSDRLLAEGIPLVLADGRSVTLRYTMRSLKAIEDAHGSLGAIDTLLNERPVGGLVSLLSVGLMHEGLDDDTLIDLLNPRQMDTYTSAVMAALDQAFPAPETVPVGKDDRANVSNGSTSTTSPPSVMAGTSAGSGR